MSKKCTQLWREARFQLEMYKAGYGVDMPKRPSTCKKGCLRRHAKKDCSRRHAKKDCLRRHAKKDCLRRHAKKCSRRHAKGDCLRRHAKKVPVDMPKEIVSVDMQKKCSRRHAKHSKCQSYIINLCFSAGIAVSMGEAAKHCSSVAVSMGEAAKLASLLVLWRRLVSGESCKTSFVFMRSRRRVYRGSCKTLLKRRRVYVGSCKTFVSACPMASPCLWEKPQNLRLCLSNGVAVSMGESCRTSCVLMCSRRRVYGGSCKTSFKRRRVYGGSCKTSVSACPMASPCLWGKLQNLVRFDALTSPCLWGNCITLVSVSLLASPCLWGKLQNIVRFDALTSPCLWGKLHNLNLCFSAGVAVSMGEAAKPRSSVAVSMGEAAKLASLLVQWRGRVYGGKLQNLVRFDVLTSPCLWGKLQNIVQASPRLWGKLQNIRVCLSYGVALFLGKAAKPRSFSCAQVAVSMGEVA